MFYNNPPVVRTIFPNLVMAQQMVQGSLLRQAYLCGMLALLIKKGATFVWTTKAQVLWYEQMNWNKGEFYRKTCDF